MTKKEAKAGVDGRGGDGRNRASVNFSPSQPPWLKSAALLGRLGMSAEGLADDFVFACFQKALLVSIAVWAYTKVVWPLMRVDKTKAT